MPASLRIEIFPADLEKCINFYITVMRFELLSRKDGYAYLGRDSIFIGADQSHHDRGLLEGVNQQSRKPPVGTEIVLEVDDLEEEREWIVSHQWRLDTDIKMQNWGLKDFRILDPDGYYLRITTHSPRGQAERDE
jgi:lactoylglutathione lyase